MMKWKVKKETTNIGALNLGNITFNEDYMEVSIDIFDISKDLKEELNKAIEIEKVRFIEDRKQLIAEHDRPVHPLNRNTVWSNQPVIMDFTYLHINLETGKPIDYSIRFGFHDAEDDYMEAWEGNITVDLSAYANQLKKEIIKVFIDKFF